MTGDGHDDPFDARMLETHVSLLFLLGDRAYKLKKPVRFDFVDLSTRPAREAMCHREVELNRRLAPDVYQGVADIMGADGTPSDHLVVMRRMPDDRRLSTLVRSADPRAEQAVIDVARQLAAFHARADRSPQIDDAGTADTVWRLWQANDAQLRTCAPSSVPVDALDRVLTLAERYIAGRRALFHERLTSGHIVDGHGDLQADDIYVLDDGPRILDCLEFADDLRYGDVASDVAFLAMDLERLGAPELATAFVDAYAATTGEPIPPSLLAFSVAYRAQVRLLVTCLRAQQTDPCDAAAHIDRARTLLDLCLHALERATVRLVLIGGPPGSGKTTIARALTEPPGWVLERSDIVRKELVGLPASERATAPIGEGIYCAEHTERTYRELLARAEHHLARGDHVVIDASWSSAGDRQRARELAAATHSSIIELACVVPPDVAARRAEHRMQSGTDASDAGAEVSRALGGAADPWPEAVTIATDGPVDDTTARATALVGP